MKLVCLYSIIGLAVAFSLPWSDEVCGMAEQTTVANNEIFFPSADNAVFDKGTASQPIDTIQSTALSTPWDVAPNRGILAWLQVLGSWMLLFNTWGILNAFGDFQAYYESGKLFRATSSDISWIGSVQSFMIFAMGSLIGPVYDRGHLRLLLTVGTSGVVFGHMMLSLCHKYWEALLAQGFVVGMGGGCLFVPALAVLTPYFESRVGLAIGIAASGSSIGGIIYPVMFTNLINRVGFKWTTRIIGFTALGTLLVPICVLKMRVKPAKVRELLDMTVFRDGPFMMCVLGCFLGYAGIYVAFFYIPLFASSTNFWSDNQSLYLVCVLNAGSVFGRTLPNWLSDTVGPLNVVLPGAIMCGVLLLCMLPVVDLAGVVVITLLLGFFSGVFIATTPILFVRLTEDKSKIGTRMGMAFAMAGLGVLVGGPGGGGILQRKTNFLDWTGAWTFAGLASLASSMAFIILRIWLGGFNPRVIV